MGSNMKFLIFLVITVSIFQAKASELDEALSSVFARDYLSAIDQLTPLAQQGNAEAQYWLGISYRMGRPAKNTSDMQNEYTWYEAAAENGNPYAMYRLGRGQYLSCELFANCKDELKHWLNRAGERWAELAQAEDPDALFEYADHAVDGITAPSWIPKPIRYYLYYLPRLRKAASTGSPLAMYYYSDNLRSKDKLQEGLNLLRKLAEQGTPKAQHKLGEILKDKKEKLFWTQQAAKKNYGDSLFSLGYFYENGIGVEKNLNKSAFYYCILVRHSGARDACYQVGQQLTEDERQAVSDKVEEWLKHNQAYYPQHPLFY